MQLNIKNFRLLMEERAGGNYNQFARLLNINVAHIYRILNKKKVAGKKVIDAVIQFCKNNNLDYLSYIFLE